MTILFVCTGNTFRSRLAEAYLNSLKLPSVLAKSAGVSADRNKNGQISEVVFAVAKSAGINKYFKDHWDQLKQEQIDKADMVVCVNRKVYRNAIKKFDLPLRTVVWDVPDFSDSIIALHKLMPGWLVNKERAVYEKIEARTNELARLVLHTPPSALVAVTDENGETSGELLNIKEVNERGIWHIGAHVVIFNEKNQLLLVKRSAHIIGSPGLWEVGVGGSSDRGESPEQTATREVSEELGIKILEKDLKNISRIKYNHYLPHYGFHMRSIITSYTLQINSSTTFRFQTNEVANSVWISIKDLGKALRKGKGDFGVLVRQIQYYKALLHSVEKEIRSRAS